MPDILAILVSERDKLNRAIAIFENGGPGPTPSPRPGPTPSPNQGHVHTAASRARMAAAQKARWAKVKVTIPKKGPFKMSAEAKAAISKAKKAWWAAKRKAEK